MSNHTPPPIISTSSASGSKPSLIDPGTAEPRGAFCPPDRDHIIELLRDLDACDEALAWIEQTLGEPADLWAACQRGDWMIWLLNAVDYDAGTMRHIACDIAESKLHIYEQAYPDDPRPRDAIAVARRYADGEATCDELIAASNAAWAAASTAADGEEAASEAAQAASWAANSTAAGDVAGAADSTAAGDAALAAASAAVGQTSWAAVWAADSDAAWTAANYAAADYAASAAARAADSDAASAAAWTTAMARHADMIRARVSWADVERAMRRAALDGEVGGD